MSASLETHLTHPRTPLERTIAELGPWFHNLHLPDGTRTAPHHPLGDFPRFKWQQIAPHLPADLTGWRALDIGCNAGFYCFELARRGASVTGIDVEERYLSGLRVIVRPGHEIYLCEPDPSTTLETCHTDTAQFFAATGRASKR